MPSMADLTLPSGPIPGPHAHTEDWYALRKFDPDRKGREVVFGASQIAAVAGMSPYSTPLQSYLEAIGEWSPFVDDEAQKRLNRGKRLEPIILDMYEEILEDEQLERNIPMYFHPQHSFIAATPDGLTRKDGIWVKTVDSKSSGFRMFDLTGEDEHKYGREGTDQCPLYILGQVQIQMAVMGLGAADVPVLVDGEDLRVFSVLRDDDLIAVLIEAARELYERIINHDPPPPNYEHVATQRVLKQIYKGCRGTIDLPKEFHELWAEREKIKFDILGMQSRIESIENRLLDAMGDAEYANLEGAHYRLKRTYYPSREVAAKSYVMDERIDLKAVKKGKS